MFGDVPGHSKSRDYRESLYLQEPAEDITDLNHPVSNEEVWQTLRKGKNNKTPGLDDIPIYFIKSALLEYRIGNPLVKVATSVLLPP